MRYLNKRSLEATGRGATLIAVAVTSGLGVLVGRGAATAAAETFTYTPDHRRTLVDGGELDTNCARGRGGDGIAVRGGERGGVPFGTRECQCR